MKLKQFELRHPRKWSKFYSQQDFQLQKMNTEKDIVFWILGKCKKTTNWIFQKQIQRKNVAFKITLHALGTVLSYMLEATSSLTRGWLSVLCLILRFDSTVRKKFAVIYHLKVYAKKMSFYAPKWVTLWVIESLCEC